MKLKLAKMVVTPYFFLVGNDGEVVDEVTSNSITLFPGKNISFEELQRRLEVDANKNEEEVNKLRDRPLL